jgi:hypothetical protein
VCEHGDDRDGRRAESERAERGDEPQPDAALRDESPSGRERHRGMHDAREACLVTRVLGLARRVGDEDAVYGRGACIDPLTANEAEAAARERPLLGLLGDFDPLRVAHDLVDRQHQQPR